MVTQSKSDDTFAGLPFGFNAQRLYWKMTAVGGGLTKRDDTKSWHLKRGSEEGGMESWGRKSVLKMV